MSRKKIVLSIGLLISDRSDTIQKCLESLTPIRKAISCQLIVTNTGHDPEVRRLAERYADIITDFTWCDDFSAARNENLRHATGEWYMYLDDDEWFVDTDDLIGFFTSGLYRRCDGACYVQRNYQMWNGQLYTDDRVSRMVRRLPESHFVSKIHEYIVPVPSNNCILNSYVEHYGYIFDTEEDRQRHYERNYKLLMEMLEENPDDQRCLTHLASEYILIRDFVRLRQLGEDCLAKLDPLTDEESRINRGTFYMCRIIASEGEKDDEGELLVCDETLADKRNTPLCLAFVHWWRAQALYRMERFAEAEKDMLVYLQEYPRITGRAAEYVIECLAILVSQCYDGIKLQDAYGMLTCIGLKRGNRAYLERFLDRFEWEKGNTYLYKDLMDELLKAFGSMEGDIFLEALQRMCSNEILKERFWSRMIEWYYERREGIREILQFCERAGYGEYVVSFLEWDIAENALIKGELEDIYPVWRKGFEQVSQNVLDFYECLYGKDFRSREAQTDACLMGLLIEAALQNEDNREDFISNMKQCASVYPRLAGAVKKLLTLYLLEPERKQEESQEELRRVRAQLLEQAGKLMETEQYGSAVELLKQVRRILPGDFETVALCLEARIEMFGGRGTKITT